MELTSLSRIELLATLDSAWTAGNRALAKMLAYLGEVERRELHVDMSCSSMFVFVERRFGLTGGSAFRRLTAARLVRRFPTIMSRVENGDIHLEALCALRDVLTAENVEEVMAATAKKTLREVEGIVACLAPRPDVKGSIRKMPEKSPPPPVAASSASSRPEPRIELSTAAEGSLFALARIAAPQTPAVQPIEQECAPVLSRIEAVAAPSQHSASLRSELGEALAAPAVAPSQSIGAPPATTEQRSNAPRPRMQQLSAARHKVQLTVSSETRAKVERAQALMRHRNPTGDLEVLFDRAMDALIEQLEKERLAKTSRPQKKQRPSKDGHIPAETRREVFERDGERCTHVDEHGNRCGCRDFLELDHIIPRAKGGSDEASNLRVACRAHNQRYAKQAFGEAYIEKRIEARRRRARNSGGASAVPQSEEPFPDRK